MLKALVIRKMTEWHEGPYGGKCPRAGSPEECSQYGILKVRSHGAILGTLMAARHVAGCRRVSAEEFPEPSGCPRPTEPGREKPINPRRWDRVALGFALVPLVILHPYPSPADPKPGCPNEGGKKDYARIGILRVLLLFARIGIHRHRPPHEQHRPCSDDQ